MTTDILRLIYFKKETIEEAILTQDIIQSKVIGHREIKSFFLTDRDSRKCCSRLILFFQYLWYAHLKQILNGLLAVIFTCLSIIILYAELAHTFGYEHNVIYDVVTVPNLTTTADYVFANLKCMVFLIYLTYATNYALFQLKVSNIYALHANRHTDPSSLLFSCTFL